MPEEKRKHKRTPLIYFLKVYDRDSGRLFGHMVDISNNGMMIMSEAPFQERNAFTLGVENMLDLDGGPHIPFDAECRWCKDTEDKQLYDGGFQIVNTSLAMQELITVYH